MSLYPIPAFLAFAITGIFVAQLSANAENSPSIDNLPPLPIEQMKASIEKSRAMILEAELIQREMDRQLKNTATQTQEAENQARRAKNETGNRYPSDPDSLPKLAPVDLSDAQAWQEVEQNQRKTQQLKRVSAALVEAHLDEAMKAKQNAEAARKVWVRQHGEQIKAQEAQSEQQLRDFQLTMQQKADTAIAQAKTAWRAVAAAQEQLNAIQKQNRIEITNAKAQLDKAQALRQALEQRQDSTWVSTTGSYEEMAQEADREKDAQKQVEIAAVQLDIVREIADTRITPAEQKVASLTTYAQKEMAALASLQRELAVQLEKKLDQRRRAGALASLVKGQRQ